MFGESKLVVDFFFGGIVFFFFGYGFVGEGGYGGEEEGNES